MHVLGFHIPKFLLIKLEKRQGFDFFLIFEKKLTFQQSALFHIEMVGLTYFELDIEVYIVNSIIFIKKNCSQTCLGSV